MQDPDAPSGVFTHWGVINISPRARALTPGAGASPIAGDALRAGYQTTNDFGRAGYSGPCPPPGKLHHYHFRLYALSAPLKKLSPVNARDIPEMTRGKVLATAELVGVYRR